MTFEEAKAKRMAAETRYAESISGTLFSLFSFQDNLCSPEAMKANAELARAIIEEARATR